MCVPAIRLAWFILRQCVCQKSKLANKWVCQKSNLGSKELNEASLLLFKLWGGGGRGTFPLEFSLMVYQKLAAWQSLSLHHVYYHCGHSFQPMDGYSPISL